MEKDKLYHLTNRVTGDHMTGHMRDDYLMVRETGLGLTFEQWINKGWTVYVDETDIDREGEIDGLHPDVVKLILEDKVIPAIKRQRELTSQGLGEAKAAVDKWRAKNRPPTF